MIDPQVMRALVVMFALVLAVRLLGATLGYEVGW